MMMKRISDLRLEDFEKHEAWTWIEEDSSEYDDMVEPVPPNVDPFRNCDAIFCKCQMLFHDETQTSGQAGIRCSDRCIYVVTFYRRGEDHVMSLHPHLLNMEEVQKACRFLQKTPVQLFPLTIAVKLPTWGVDKEQTFELPTT
ncbi:MAG: hypothetical protein ABFD69_01245 [Candidatus Sumerlaeia bacterium]